MKNDHVSEIGLEDYISCLMSDANAIRQFAMELSESGSKEGLYKAHSILVLADHQISCMREITETRLKTVREMSFWK